MSFDQKTLKKNKILERKYKQTNEVKYLACAISFRLVRWVQPQPEVKINMFFFIANAWPQKKKKKENAGPKHSHLQICPFVFLYEKN